MSQRLITALIGFTLGTIVKPVVGRKFPARTITSTFFFKNTTSTKNLPFIFRGGDSKISPTSNLYSSQLQFSSKKMASNDEVPEWTLMYHHFDPPFPGRAQAIRLMLVDAGVPYDETGDNLYGPEGFCDMFRGTGDNKKVFTKEGACKHNAPYPVMAPPLIWHRPKDGKEVFINQLPAIMRYVGTILGYCPTDPAEVALCDKILLDVCDYITEGRNSFHPVNGHASYSIQKEEGDRVSKEWTQRRMLIWLHSFEKMLEKRTSEEGYIVGDKVSYADIALYWLCEATEAQFDKEWYDFAWTKADTPLLKAFKEKFDKRPNIAGWTGRFEYSGDSLM